MWLLQHFLQREDKNMCKAQAAHIAAVESRGVKWQKTMKLTRYYAFLPMSMLTDIQRYIFGAFGCKLTV
jgi:hypothetical protein